VDEGLKIGLKVAEALSQRHPGPTYDHNVTGQAIEIMARHPVHNWKIGVDLGNPVTAADPVGAGLDSAMRGFTALWSRRLEAAIQATEVTTSETTKTLSKGMSALIDLMDQVNGKIIFIGNGGSSAIAGHMAEDFTKNGKMRAISFGDPALLTCYANDYGWDSAYDAMIADYSDPGDLVIGISSSGNSKSITNAMDTAKEMGCKTVTFSGFSPDNALRTCGQLNFYTPASQYGFVETAHAAILHMALDIHGGWVGQL